MSLLGIHLSLWMGPTLAVPVPYSIAEALTSVQVTHNDTGPSGFQLTFQIGRSGPLDLLDYGLLKNPLIRPFSRVILLVRFAVVPHVLMDGIITRVNLSPSEEPGASTLTVTGEDVSVMMDLKQNHRSFPGVPDFIAVGSIITEYFAKYGLTPPEPPLDPEVFNPYNPLYQIPQQPANVTDRAYLVNLARQYGFVFYVTPGPLPAANQVHWGPPKRLSLPQSALSVNMGPATNVDSISFSFDGLRPQEVAYKTTQVNGTVSSPSLSRSIPLVSDRAEARRFTWLVNNDHRRIKTQAQGMVDQAFDEVVTATGQLDALRYNGLLKPRGLVGLRGVGKTYDGLYYVKTVSHSISKGRYTQDFSLSREGTGTLTPFVPP